MTVTAAEREAPGPWDQPSRRDQADDGRDRVGGRGTHDRQGTHEAVSDRSHPGHHGADRVRRGLPDGGGLPGDGGRAVVTWVRSERSATARSGSARSGTPVGVLPLSLAGPLPCRVPPRGDRPVVVGVLVVSTRPNHPAAGSPARHVPHRRWAALRATTSLPATTGRRSADRRRRARRRSRSLRGAPPSRRPAGTSTATPAARNSPRIHVRPNPTAITVVVRRPASDRFRARAGRTAAYDRGFMRRLSIARSLQLALLGLTVALTASRPSACPASTAPARRTRTGWPPGCNCRPSAGRLLAAGVVEEATLRLAGGPEGLSQRRRARAAYREAYRNAPRPRGRRRAEHRRGAGGRRRAAAVACPSPPTPAPRLPPGRRSCA